MQRMMPMHHRASKLHAHMQRPTGDAVRACSKNETDGSAVLVRETGERLHDYDY
jgi:hypothetical protein